MCNNCSTISFSIFSSNDLLNECLFKESSQNCEHLVLSAYCSRILVPHYWNTSLACNCMLSYCHVGWGILLCAPVIAVVFLIFVIPLMQRCSCWSCAFA